MAITLPEVVSHIEKIGYQVMVPPNQDTECGIRFRTDSYVDVHGQKSLLIVCRLADEGTYLEVGCPNAYSSAQCRFKAALYSAMLHIAFQTKFLQLEHDPADGEIRFAVDIPVCDGTVTMEQLHTMILCLVQTLEEFHPVLVHAMQHGKVDMGLVWKPAASEQAATPQKSPIPAELAELLAKAGGIEGVESLLARLREEGGGAR
jgi:hypothetical protein